MPKEASPIEFLPSCPSCGTPATSGSRRCTNCGRGIETKQLSCVDKDVDNLINGLLGLYARKEDRQILLAIDRELENETRFSIYVRDAITDEPKEVATITARDRYYKLSVYCLICDPEDEMAPRTIEVTIGWRDLKASQTQRVYGVNGSVYTHGYSRLDYFASSTTDLSAIVDHRILTMALETIIDRSNDTQRLLEYKHRMEQERSKGFIHRLKRFIQS